MAKRESVYCDWCKSLDDSEGNTIYFCMDTDGGNYLGETGLCGWCGEDCEQEETDDETDNTNR